MRIMLVFGVNISSKLPCPRTGILGFTGAGVNITLLEGFFVIPGAMNAGGDSLIHKIFQFGC
jgi:hypothetical protein